MKSSRASGVVICLLFGLFLCALAAKNSQWYMKWRMESTDVVVVYPSGEMKLYENAIMSGKRSLWDSTGLAVGHSEGIRLVEIKRY